MEKKKANENQQGERKSAELYCYCQQPQVQDFDEGMIGCDNTLYKLIGVHYKCAKIKRLPKGNWYYKDCKKKKLN